MLFLLYQKREYNRLKHSLEKWRELILLVYSLLIWEQKFYPGVIAGLVTVFFLLFWYMNLTLVTSVALFGLSVTLFDYFYPKISRMFLKSENWNAVQENKFEQVVERLFQVKNKAKAFGQYVLNAKSEKSTLVSSSCPLSPLLPRS